MSDIFLSYASADRERAKQVADLLEQQGWSVWWDRSIPAGKTFDRVIEEELERSRCVVVLWSRTSVQSDWVRTEAADGARRKILVPALIEKVEIPLEFRRVQAADISDSKSDSESSGFRSLCASIAECLDAVTPPVQPKRTRTLSRLALGVLALTLALTLTGIVGLLKHRKAQERTLATSLASASTATLNALLDKGENSGFYWPLFLSDKGGSDLLERSVLLAVESVRHTSSAEGEEALRHGLGFLVRPSRVLEHEDEVSALVLSTSGEHLAAASATVRVWETASGRQITQISDGVPVRCVAFSPDGKLLATASTGNATAAIWDALTGRAVHRIDHENIAGMAFSRDGMLLATASYNDNSVKIWDIKTGQEIARLVPDRPVEGVLFDNDAQHVITRLASGLIGPVAVWESRTGKRVQQLDQDSHSVEDFALSPDGTRLATASSETVRIYTVGQWDEVITAASRTLKRTLAFSADGQKLAVGGDASVEIMSPSTGELKPLAVGSSPVRFVAFSRDARYVVSVHQDWTARVWETDGGRELMRVPTSEQAHNSCAPVAFSPDGRFLIAIGESSVNYWPLFPVDIREEACHRLTRNLTQAEWQEFLPNERYRKTCSSLP